MYFVRCSGISAIVLTLWLACMPRSAVAALPVSETTLRQDISSAAGVPWKFEPEGHAVQSILVPGGGWRAQGLTCDAGAYSAVIPIPLAAKGRVIRIAFEAVNFGAAVQAGPDPAHLVTVASHLNGWVPFSADVSKVAVPGRPLFIRVEVKGRRKFLVNGKYTVPEGATWCPYVADGILRGVSLELLPTVHLDDVFVRTDVTHHLLATSVTLTNASAATAALTLIPRLSSASGDTFSYPKLPTQRLSLAAGETRTVELAKSAWTLGPKSFWWPNVPYAPGYRTRMHALEVVLTQNDTAVHRMTRHFGFRQFEAHGSHYFLNGVRCNLRGDNQQEANFGTDAYGIRPGFGPPSPGNAGWPQAVDNLQRLNFNILRIHQIPATTYMLDVCDTRGLMLIDESPLRGSEGGEDFVNGHDAMLNMDRELVRRDRNHPAVVIWSAANEWSDPIREAVPAIQAIDDTRPIIADGIGDMGAPYINMDHYVNGIYALPRDGGHVRDDRPYGETEDIWASDNTRQGFAWMATSIRARRLKGNADLRNYTLNNAWSNYVPGESPDNEILELKVKGMDVNGTILPALADPWHDANIMLMQQCYHPVAVCDTEFDQANLRSDREGHWPVAKPRLLVGASVVRHLAVFNDEFSGTGVTLVWEAHAGTKTGPVLGSGRLNLTIPLGEFRMQDIVFHAPKTPGELTLVLAATKNGRAAFRDDLPTFQVVTDVGALVPNGDYLLINENSGLAVGGPGADGGLLQAAIAESPVWHLTNLGGGDVSLTRNEGGKRLGIRAASNDNGAAAEETLGEDAVTSWHLSDQGSGAIAIINRKSGKLLDVYARATLAGARIVQWEANGGANQFWRFRESRH